MRRRALALAALALGIGAACTPASAPEPDRAGLFVLGIDGLDPVILDRMMAEGKLPHFAELARGGSYQRLGTSNPPQSPVAWSNFATGRDPGGHGIFDFVHRDPATYLPISSATPPVDDHGHALDLFGFMIPIGAPEVKNNRSGTPWWDALVAAGVDTEVYRFPGNYPVPASSAKVLAGMGTVDMRGGYGTYTLLADHPVQPDDPKGDIQRVSVQDFDLDGKPDTVEATLKGPPDLFHLKPGQIPGAGDYLTARITVHLDPDSDTAVVKVGDEDVLLRAGEWSDWVQVEFEALPLGMMNLQGAVRFFAKELRPGFELYASAVNLSAEAPPQVFTSPDDWVETLYTALGQFYTQGMPEETGALRDGVFSDDDYLEQVGLVQKDSRTMLELALDHFHPGGATFFYLSDIDLQCHMLWRHADPKYPGLGHPARDPAIAPAHAHDIEKMYRDVDTALGRVRERLPEGTLLIVMSDHGFQPFLRKFHLNAWLRDHGYLVLKGEKRTGRIGLEDVDWQRSRAYGIGFNGLYLNLAGRESQGSVRPEDAPALLAEIAAALEAERDPANGKTVVVKAYPASEVFHGERVSEAPDLVVGYNSGYAGSDPSTLGEITEAVLEDNTSRWSGNHLIDPRLVPGVLMTNAPLRDGEHDLTDVTASILDHFGVRPLPGMVGTSFLAGDANSHSAPAAPGA
ncbi:MAG TPA: alkaline phosphatase family protein [Myxococcota bacterium]|nr:alkaline phosphatase family protein [Myxococcota bacterium]